MKNKQNFAFRWNPRQAGFTLIELLVTIVIIGVLATISVSTFSNYIDKGHQAKSYALQGQIDTLIQVDCINQGYSCGKNIVPNWAFSDGDTGEWALGSYYEINNYKLFHDNRLPGSNTTDYIIVPVSSAMTPGGIYRVDVVARKVDTGTTTVAMKIGFSGVASGIGVHTRINHPGENLHMCDVFQYPSAGAGDIRLFARAGVLIEFDEVSIREVDGYSDIANNNDCALGIGVQ